MATKKRQPQKVVITITDEDIAAGLVDIEMVFKPTLSPNARTTPAVQFALRVLALAKGRAGTTAAREALAEDCG